MPEKVKSDKLVKKHSGEHIKDGKVKKDKNVNVDKEHIKDKDHVKKDKDGMHTCSLPAKVAYNLTEPLTHLSVGKKMIVVKKNGEGSKKRSVMLEDVKKNGNGNGGGKNTSGGGNGNGNKGGDGGGEKKDGGEFVCLPIHQRSLLCED